MGEGRRAIEHNPLRRSEQRLSSDAQDDCHEWDPASGAEALGADHVGHLEEDIRAEEASAVSPFAHQQQTHAVCAVLKSLPASLRSRSRPAMRALPILLRTAQLVPRGA